MPLKPPSFFDELPRMRTPSRHFDPSTNFVPMLKQLTDACRTYKYLAISPQNLSEPALLLRAIVAKDGLALRPFVDPVIVKKSGLRIRYEACANIFLMRAGSKFHPGVLVPRPTSILLSARSAAGKKRLHRFRDTEPQRSVRNGLIGAVCHELDHTRGRLIVDYARDALVETLAAIDAADRRKEKLRLAHGIPFVFVRDGDVYVLRHGVEFLGIDVPPVSPDTLFVSAQFGAYQDIHIFRVPRGGEQLPIRYSDLMSTFYE